MTAYGRYHSAYFAHRVTLEGRDEDALAKSLSTARVETKPHQVDAALFALHSPLSKGVILADEVGLGKTIEASLVIAQRWAERRRRILLIVPASLRKQWQQELREKFSLPSCILDARTARDLVKAGQQRPFDSTSSIILTSYEFAARRADDIARIAWDLVVFDEAHRMRNVYKKSGSARAKALRDALNDRFKLLLTATPLQNSLLELYGLVSVIDGNFFGDESTFKTMYGGTRPSAVTLGNLRDRITPIYKRHLRRDVQEAGHVSFTNRMATTFDFEPSDKETELYESVSAYLQQPDSIAFGLKPNQLVIIQARKILGSSVVAIAGFLETVLARLRRQQVADESTVEDVGDAEELAEEIQEAALDANDGDEEDQDDDTPKIDTVRLEAEISEVEAYLAMARAIGPNAKGEKLVAKLSEVLDEIQKRGGSRKAVIFTESVRTQRYLAELLSQHGYAGQLVLMNGSNSDSESQAIYKAWKEKHAGTDVVSGSKSADMKAAVVEAFRSEEKSILIATESGAEGINLQFCSVLVNFDLPWNPQRVEQRIGRCHRYGQMIDVTVVNMLNRRNKAERRVYELLDQKFKLFSGVFGASDGVLGAIESGIDFERKVVEAVQRGRTEAEVEEGFRLIEEQLAAQIDSEMEDARRKLFDNLDRDVVARLRARNEAIMGTLGDFEQRLLTLVRAELPDARFHSANGPRFDHAGQTYTTEWPLADEKGWQFFRLADGTLACELVDTAKARQLDNAALAFDYHAYRSAGNAKLADVERLAGRSGWLTVSLLTLAPTDPKIGQRQRLLVSGFANDGNGIAAIDLDPKTVDDLFLVPATSRAVTDAVPTARLDALHEIARTAALSAEQEASVNWLNEETEKLDAYADDLDTAANIQIKEKETIIKAAKKALRSNTEMTLDEKIKEQRRIKTMDREKLLRTDGTLFCQLNDDEMAYGKVLLDEVFGRSNFLNQVSVKMKQTAGASGGGEDKRLKKNIEYILIYARDKDGDAGFKKFNDAYDEEDLFELIQEMRDDGKSWKYTRVLRSLGKKEFLVNAVDGSGQQIKIFRHVDVVMEPITTIMRDEKLTEQECYVKYFDKIFRDTNAQSSIRTRVMDATAGQGDFFSIEYTPRSGKNKGRLATLYYKGANCDLIAWLSDVVVKKGSRLYKLEKTGTYWEGFPLNNLTKEGGVQFPQGKKPEALIRKVLELATEPGDLVLDSFAGSGTTGAVAQKMRRRWIMVELGEHCHTHIIPRMKRVIEGTDQGGITEAVDWKGGGGFRYYRLAPSLLERDRFGHLVIAKSYNAAMLAESVCQLMGFTYAPSQEPEEYWKHGYSTESDFIFVTTQALTHGALKIIADEVGPDRTLLVCCKAFNTAETSFSNLTLRKIPMAVLGKCEWGRDDYSLSVATLPIGLPTRTVMTAIEPESAFKKRGHLAKTDSEPSLFDAVSDE